MEEALGIPVIPISAAKNEGVGEVITHAMHVAQYQEKPQKQDFCGMDDHNGALHRALHAMMHLIVDHCEKANLPVQRVKKLHEGRPNIYDMITNGDIDMIINTPIGKDSVNDDSYLRKAAIKAKVPYMTTVSAAKATADGIHYLKKHGGSEVKSLQELHSEIHDKE